MSDTREYNFDGIIGPTHNYAGLSTGNLASTRNQNAPSNPRAAALEGLAKMRLLHDLGVPQAVLPPQMRPHLPTLRKMGFDGTDAAVLENVTAADPTLLAACSSASAMWAANAATVSPSADADDARVHFTPANLCGLLHRSIETVATGRLLRAVFADPKYFVHHDPLPSTPLCGDEGAANHMRFTNGLEVFVYGRDGVASTTQLPARQTLTASRSIARFHQLSAAKTLFIRQNSAAIDAGAFHNDVVAVSHENMLFFHELAFADLDEAQLSGIHCVRVPSSRVPLDDAVRSYLFNSQIVTVNGELTLIAPAECREVESVRRYLRSPPESIKRVHFVDVRQSMRNGGGPACLRLRVTLTARERAAAAPGIFFDASLHERLVRWVERHYRETLSASDLADPQLLIESRAALDELSEILNLESLSEFSN